MSTATIAQGFPHDQRLGGRDLFIEVLGRPSDSTFQCWLKGGKTSQAGKARSAEPLAGNRHGRNPDRKSATSCESFFRA
jgi:hypothetical protein